MHTDDTQAVQELPAVPIARAADTAVPERYRERGPQVGTAPEHVRTAPGDSIPKWQQRIWVGCSIGLMLMIVALCFIVIFALGKMMLLLEIRDSDHLFQFAGMNLVSGSLLRLLAILIGGAIAFVGLAVSFFAHQKATSLDASLAKEDLLSARVALATYSPGIIAIVVGAVVIMASIFARGTYNYRPAAVSNQGVQHPAAVDPLPPPMVFQDEREEKDGHPSEALAPGD
jgi:hypothetical protein